MKKVFLVYSHYDDKSFNAAIKNTFIENVNGDFSSGTLYLGFNISRAFTLAGENEKLW